MNTKKKTNWFALGIFGVGCACLTLMLLIAYPQQKDSGDSQPPLPQSVALTAKLNAHAAEREQQMASPESLPVDVTTNIPADPEPTAVALTTNNNLVLNFKSFKFGGPIQQTTP